MTDWEKVEHFVCISCLDEERYSFVSHISDALRRKGINDVVVGVDSDDMLSTESQAKVEKARVSVMVLPGNCEPTTACLNKFVKVLECQSNNDHVVVPVLYGDIPLKDKWLSVLNLRGLSPIHQSRMECSDSELVEEIVRDVYEKLFCMGRIGIYSKLLEIENMVCKQPVGIRCIGIWGMPGIGKTTLAKAVFDQISGNFDAYCFIGDYDKASHEKGLYRLLEEQFLKEKPGTGSTAITKLSLLKEKLNKKRVLVVLDDVRNPLVAESFLEGFDWFGRESLIIITSRDKQVFRLCRIHQIYEVQGLNVKEALQLFLLCASTKDVIDWNLYLYKLSMKVIKHANGNPLALSIYGKELKGISKKELSETDTAFLKLKQRPLFKFVDAFKSSYDTLSDSEKNIFLDIACFFQGENVNYVMKLLEGCGFFPHVGIDVLVDKCLVTISENLVQMHNLTQDVGREIINGETIQIERRSRLWEPWNITYLLEDNEHKTTLKRAQGTEDIEGMFLDMSYVCFDVKPDVLENMLNLRLLKIYCSNPEILPKIIFPEGFYPFLPNELRLLHWEKYPLESLPQSFDPMHLVEINMPYSQLQKLWGGTKNLDMLRVIRLCHSQQLVDVEDLLKAHNLEVIDLQGCTRLQNFPATGQLLHLQVVNLSGCKEIKIFPEVPPNIETLHLRGTGIIGLPLSISKLNGGELENLLAVFEGLSDALKLEFVTCLEKSRSSSQYLGKLICLDLKDCSLLRSLPNMANLEFLKVLDLSGCSELETIQGFPRNLKELCIAGTAVREVPQLPQTLELLNAHGCVSLKSIPLDYVQLPMHYTFSNCFVLSPQVVNNFLVKVLANVKSIPRENPQELDKALAFSFCSPSQANQDFTLDLQPGSSVMTQLNPSWRSTLVGFAMLVEVAFSEKYNDASGFGISCVCRWKNKEGHSSRIERILHCWAPEKAVPKVQKDHMFVFCDVKMHPSTDEGNDTDIWADLVVFEFFPVNKLMKRLDDTCKVTRCGVYVIAPPTGNTSLDHISAALSLKPMEFSGNEVEVLRGCDGLQEISKALFLNMACLFNDEDDWVAPFIASIEVDISSGLEDLANRSLIHVSSNGNIRVSSNVEKVMHYLLGQMGKEILRRQSMLPGSSKDLTMDFERVSTTSSSSRNWKYDVYPNFSGQDVGRNFLSHLLVSFKHKLIVTFMDNEMGRDKLSSPLFVQAIRDSRISIVVLSKKYASSSWLLNELVEIAKCKQELGQKVIPIFYDVDPSDVQTETGEFWRHFKQTCKSKRKDVRQQWHRALLDIANIPGYYYCRGDNEANMIEKIAFDVSNTLFCTPSVDVPNTLGCTRSIDVHDLVGIEAHTANMNSLLCLESDEVKMVGIWGPQGVGKSTIARFLYSDISLNFQQSAFVDMSRCSYRLVQDDYQLKLYFQELVLSALYQEDIRINCLGEMKKRLKDQKVLIILDGVDKLLLLEAVAKERGWFGPGSRIIVITDDQRVLRGHRINYIYKVDLPSKKQALQMFCQFAFGKKIPPYGFVELATEVAECAGNLPLGLKVFGSYLRGMNKEEWVNVLPWLRNSLDGQIESILKFGYDGLNEEDKGVFLHVACLFNHCTVKYITRLLDRRFPYISKALDLLARKSLIQISEHGNVTMHHLHQKLGREIVRKQSIYEPGERQFLVDCQDICDLLVEDAVGTKYVIGISLDMSEIKELFISKRGFEGMNNLQFLKFYTSSGDKEVKVRLPYGLDYLPRRLRLLHWEGFPMRCWPSDFITNFVELTMESSKLEELWAGVQPLNNLVCMNLRGSLDLREIPDLSLATNLETMNLGGCSSLTKLPSSIWNLHKLKDLDMERCIKVEVLPTGFNLESLNYLNLNGCSLLRSFPEISRSISDLYLDGTAIEEVPCWIENISRLSYLSMNGCNKLKKISPNISKLKGLVVVDFSKCEALTEDSWKNHPEEITTSLMIVDMSGNSFERLPDTWTSIQPKDLILDNCKKLVSLPELPASLSMLSANGCESLETLHGPLNNPWMALQLFNCFNLNHQAREFILHSDCAYAILPGSELPACFTYRVAGNLLTVSLRWIPLLKNILRFKACIVVEPRSGWFDFGVITHLGGGNDNKYFSCLTNTFCTRDHLIIFGFEFSPDEVNDPSAEYVQFEFFCLDLRKEMVKIKECGLKFLEVTPSLNNSRKSSEIEDGDKPGEYDAEPRRSVKRVCMTKP